MAQACRLLVFIWSRACNYRLVGQIMVVGIGKISLALHGARSLKDKRKTIKSVKDRVKAKFNVSIAEVGEHDYHQSASIGVCVIASDKENADSQLQRTINFISSQSVVVHIATEFVTL